MSIIYVPWIYKENIEVISNFNPTILKNSRYYKRKIRMKKIEKIIYETKGNI